MNIRDVTTDVIRDVTRNVNNDVTTDVTTDVTICYVYMTLAVLMELATLCLQIGS